MKKYFLNLIFIFLSITSFINAQEKFVLEAKISGLDDNTRLIINPFLPNMNINMDDETIIYPKNGKFRLEGNYPVPTKLCIRFRSEDSENWQASEEIYFWAENVEMTLKGEKGNVQFAQIEGSEIQNQYNIFNTFNLPLKLESNKNTREIKEIVYSKQDIPLEERKRISERNFYLSEKIIHDNLKFILNHPEYYISGAELIFYITFQSKILDKEKVRDFYNNLSGEYKDNTYGRQIKKFLKEEQIVYKILEIGDKPYSFILFDKDGEEIDLKSFKDKYILLDFWASSCGPCKAEHKNYFENFEKYKSKDFEILSVSQDQSKRLWEKAMERDNMIWESVWDEKLEVSKMYNISALPTNYLIDKKGIIIAKNIRGEELSQKLVKLFEN